MNKNLPDLCYSILETTGELIIIKQGEEGYYPCEFSVADKAQNEALRDSKNESMGVTKEQEKAMSIGSMFGWHVPFVKDFAGGDK